MTFQAKTSIGLPGRIARKGETLDAGELGESIGRLLSIGAIEPLEEEPAKRRRKDGEVR